jgi:phosphoenolpyruvate carboxylase
MALHERDVRQDVRELGDLLGDVLEAQASTAAFETVEDVRERAIGYRRGDVDSRERLVEVVKALDPERASSVARAFTTYFELVNLAEERERVRTVRRSRQTDELEDSLPAAAAELGDADVDVVAQTLDDVLVEPTFTAHPTEARRKTVKAKLRSIAESLEDLDQCSHTDLELARQWRDIEAEVTSLWQTPQVRGRPPTPDDEARNVQWYLQNTLFDVVGEVYDTLERELDDAVPADLDVPKLLEFRSWAGSDRDGNPYVTPEVTERTLDRQRTVALERYRDRLKALSGVVSQDGERCPPTDAFEASLEADREQLPGVTGEIEERYPDEPYRQKLKLMRERVDRVGDVRPGGYDDANELLADLDVLAASLDANGADAIVDAHVQPLVREVETFGFTLAGLDLRDHREKHTEAVGEALAREGIAYADMDEDARIETLTDAILQDNPVVDVTDVADVSETTERVLRLFDAFADWQREYGADAIDTYAISMTERPSHVLEVLFLADQAGVVSLPEYSGVDVVPLLETESALENARDIMGTLFENDAYGAAIDARGDVQEVMLGYSDSNKENGFLTANWRLYENQRRIAAVCRDHDVTLRLFHGRGGSISRGGGPIGAALLARPSDAVSGMVKFTEQGEVLAERYANPQVAERSLEQLLSAQLRSRKRAIEHPEPDVHDDWAAAMGEMADDARDAYRDLLESDGFVSYFEQATPITVIEDLNLGSRPASRTGERKVEDLRAIPWVFSWTQSRCVLPGWYGLATAIDEWLEDDGDVETLRDMYESWPVFTTLLDNAAVALARTDMEIASHYADLAEPALRERFFPRLDAEYERACELVKTITSRETVYAREWFGESLDRRNPYVDPLHLLQVDLLDRTHRTPDEERTLRLTVKGIAAGMKNTG